MGVGEVPRRWGCSVTSLHRLDVITSPACAQITFCEIESLTANCLFKVTGAKGVGVRQMRLYFEKPDLFRYNLIWKTSFGCAAATTTATTAKTRTLWVVLDLTCLCRLRIAFPH